MTFRELLCAVALVAIVIVFAAALFDSDVGPRDGGPRAQASTDAQSIVSAVKAYYTEYGFYPGELDSSAKKRDRAVGDPAAGLVNVPNNAIFDILRAIPSPANPDNIHNKQKILFLESKSVPDPAHPKGGFLDDPNAPPGLKGCFFDPWGHQYCVVMDTNGDGQIDLSPFYKDFSGNSAPHVGVGAFSLGRDGLLGKKGNHLYRDGTDKSDDIVSWSY